MWSSGSMRWGRLVGVSKGKFFGDKKRVVCLFSCRIIFLVSLGVSILIKIVIGVQFCRGVFHLWKQLFNHVVLWRGSYLHLAGGGVLVSSTCTLALFRKTSLNFCRASSVLLVFLHCSLGRMQVLLLPMKSLLIQLLHDFLICQNKILQTQLFRKPWSQAHTPCASGSSQVWV